MFAYGKQFILEVQGKVGKGAQGSLCQTLNCYILGVWILSYSNGETRRCLQRVENASLERRLPGVHRLHWHIE